VTVLVEPLPETASSMPTRAPFVLDSRAGPHWTATLDSYLLPLLSLERLHLCPDRVSCLHPHACDQLAVVVPEVHCVREHACLPSQRRQRVPLGCGEDGLRAPRAVGDHGEAGVEDAALVVPLGVEVPAVERVVAV